MGTASLASPKTANVGGAKTCTKTLRSCSVSALQAAITDLIYEQNPHKAWAFVADLFGLKERAAKYRLANTVSYTIEELQVLFQGEDGLEYLNAMMADAQPRWWKLLRKEIDLCLARGYQAKAQQIVLKMEPTEIEIPSRRRLKRFSDADKRFNAKASEQETAVGLLLADGGGAVHSAVAPAKAQTANRKLSGRR